MLQKIILFDGDCNLCAASVQFIIKRDPKGVFAFTSLQSEVRQRMLNKYHVPGGIDSLILIEPENHKYYLKSSAALNICNHLSGLWRMVTVLKLVPRPIRDRVYDIVARNRIKWFGRKDQCILPSPEIWKRFL